MAEITPITEDTLTEIAAETGFRFDLIEKDYYITLLLYLLKDVSHIYFKGGTALQKIILNYTRLSEDIDFTVTEDVAAVRDTILGILKDTPFFTGADLDKRVDRFTRIMVHFRGFRGNAGTIFIDLNQKGRLQLPPEKSQIPHFYEGYIPTFSSPIVAEKEMIAEKMRATIERNKPRDHFDLYQIIKRGIPIDLSLVQDKCKDTGHEMDIIKMFNNANKLKNRWDEDMVPLLAKGISFAEVMKGLAQHFKLKEEKDKKKKIEYN